MNLENEFLNSEKGLGLLSKLFHSSGEGMMVFDSNGEAIGMNPRAESMFGWKESEFLGRRVEDLIPPSRRKAHQGHRKGYMKKPAVRSMGSGVDLQGLRKDGTTFPIEISLTYLDHENEMMVVAFITDISVRKEQEKKLEQYATGLQAKVRMRTRELEQMNMGLQSQIQERKLAEKALKESLEEIKRAEKEILKSLEREKELNELKSRFVSMASHEFRTPLTTISSSANLIRKYTEESQQPNREKHIERISASVRNLTGILNDFLSLEKLESGITEIKWETVDLHETLEDIIQEMSLVLKNGQRIECRKGENSLFKTDLRFLRNLIYNLVSNASKYSNEGDVIEIGCFLKEKSITIEVTDHGIGIPKKEQKDLFSRFFRAGNVTNIQGTGLGLNIVKKYLDLLEGKITFESNEGIGSTFTISLPLRS